VVFHKNTPTVVKANKIDCELGKSTWGNGRKNMRLREGGVRIKNQKKKTWKQGKPTTEQQKRGWESKESVQVVKLKRGRGKFTKENGKK